MIKHNAKSISNILKIIIVGGILCMKNGRI